LISSIQYGCAIRKKHSFISIEGKTIDNILLCEDSLYFNNLIVKNSKGKLYVINTIEEKKDIVIIWINGYISTGLFLENKPFGKWCTFDDKSRLRSYMFFGNDGEFLLTLVEFDKKGNVVKHNEASVPFN